MDKPYLLDLFCGAGGCTRGYQTAGFYVVGVDHRPQPRYCGDQFVQAGALEFVAQMGRCFDMVHASPPCQINSITASLPNVDRTKHIDLIPQTRELLKATGKPYVIENVPGAALENPLMLCGTMFGLRVQRHRLFETWPAIWWPPTPCQHVGRTAPLFWGDLLKAGHRGGSHLEAYRYITVSGHSFIKADAQRAMGIDWMINSEMSQAVPPAYTEWLGRQIISKL